MDDEGDLECTCDIGPFATCPRHPPVFQATERNREKRKLKYHEQRSPWAKDKKSD